LVAALLLWAIPWAIWQFGKNKPKAIVAINAKNKFAPSDLLERYYGAEADN